MLAVLLALAGVASPASRAADGESRVEEDHPAVRYDGPWSRHAGAYHSKGSAALAMDAGSRVTFSFAGTGVAWLGYRDEWSGIARVSIDGGPAEAIDTAASPAAAQAVLFTASGLEPGVHTLTLEVTGTHGPESSGAWIWVDAFALPTPPVLVPRGAAADAPGPGTACR